MSKHIHWLLSLDISKENVDKFQSVVKEVVEAAENESGTVLYEYYFNEDGTHCNIHERFVDSDAALKHLNGFAVFAGRFLGAASPSSISVYGTEIHEDLKNELAGFSPNYFETKTGFSRFSTS